MKPFLIFLTLTPALAAGGMVILRIAFPAVFRHPEPLAQPTAGHESSLAAMLVGLVFAMTAFLTGFGWLIVRGLKNRRNLPGDGEPAHTPSVPPAKPRRKPAAEPAAPWERPADWWKSADDGPAGS